MDSTASVHMLERLQLDHQHLILQWLFRILLLHHQLHCHQLRCHQRCCVVVHLYRHFTNLTPHLHTIFTTTSFFSTISGSLSSLVHSSHTPFSSIISLLQLISFNRRILLAMAYPTKKKRSVHLHPFKSYGGVPKFRK